MTDSECLPQTPPKGRGVGFIHSTESFGAVDGPGVRFLIFMQGCEMRCRYCHNPDTWELPCKGAGKKMTVEDLLNQAERYRSYWGEKGGITVSGGEALLQIDFLIDLFEESHRRGINTCLDTAAQPFTREEPFFSKFRRLMQSTDTVLLDIKHMDDDAHRHLTGHTNKNILDCAQILSDWNIPVWIRHVLVPGITDSEDHLRQLGLFLKTLDNVERVEILPYHTLGIIKWEKLGKPYTLNDVKVPTAEDIKKAEEILRSP